MRAITAHLAKPLLYLPGGSLLDHQVALLTRMRLRHICVVTRCMGQQIERAVRGSKGVTTLRQGPPGTLIGAIATALETSGQLCLVLHGDNYFSHDLRYLADEAREHFKDANCRALFAVDAEVTSKHTGDRLAGSGCYVLSARLLPMVNELSEHDQLCALTESLLEHQLGVRKVPLRGWRLNINEPADLLATSRRILGNWSTTFHCPQAEEGYHPHGGSFGREGPVWVSPEAVVTGSALSPFTVVGPGATVRGSVLRETIVFPGAEVVDQELTRAIVLAAPGGRLVLPADSYVGPDHEGHP
jgi:NDP-sugar pyrophosphorylase family protein